MAFDRPTITELRDRISADISARLGTGPLLDKSVLKVLAVVTAGGAHLLHGHLEFIAKQVIWDTAESEFLERWASIFGLTRKAASFSTGAVRFTGVSGNPVPIGTKIRRDDGIEFQTTIALDLSAGFADIAVISITSGDVGDTASLTIMQTTSPVAGVDASVLVNDPGLTGGTDQETDAELLARLLVRLQTPPQGGAKADYELWALLVPGVTRAFGLPQHLGVGTVGVTFVTDGESSPIPDAAKVAEVQASIDAFRPVTVKQALVFAPSEVTLDPQIQLKPNTADVRAEVTAALDALLLAESEPGGTQLLSRIKEAISNAPGEIDHILDDPSADVTVLPGELLTLGLPVFTTLN